MPRPNNENNRIHPLTAQEVAVPNGGIIDMGIEIPETAPFEAAHEMNPFNDNVRGVQLRTSDHQSCSICGQGIEYMDETHQFHWQGNQLWCDSHYNELFFTCQECGDVYTTGEQVVVHGEGTFCSSCADERYGPLTHCRSCREYFMDEDPEWQIGNCRSCARGEGVIEIKAWDARPEFTNDATSGEILASKRPIGVELETFYGDQKKAAKATRLLHPAIGVGTDSSIQGGRKGIEFRLPPISGAKAEEMIRKTCLTLREGGFAVNNSCGLHIHFDMSEFDEMSAGRQLDVIKNVWLAYMAFEDVIVSFLPKSRRNNRYCQIFRSEYRMKEIMDAKNMDSLERIWYRVKNMAEVSAAKADHRGLDTRYRGINLHPFFAGRHLEIRYHTGTLNARKILEWANLHARIIDAASQPQEWGYLESLINSDNLTNKTQALFAFAGLSNESCGYFRARQASFYVAPSFGSQDTSFKSGMAELENEKES